MHAADVMTTNVITVSPATGVKEIAGLLLKHRISAMPVVNSKKQVLGIVSEGDLMRRAENQTDQQHSWWLDTVFAGHEKAADYIKTHGLTANDVMTREVATVQEDATLGEIAELLESRRIKRVPVTRDRQLVGIVSRANLLHGLAAKADRAVEPGAVEDRTIRKNLLHSLGSDAGLDTSMINVVVKDGTVEIWGIVRSGAERKAAQIAAESTTGITAVVNHLGKVPPWLYVY